jgi:exopolysaccharide biosynthesis polyprenyl glycosylphosphotransferase
MKRGLLFWGDVAILYLALIITLVIRYGAGDFFRHSLALHIFPFSLVFALWLLIFYIANLYEISLSKNNVQFFSAFFYSIAINLTITVIFFYLVAFFRITPKTNLSIFLVLWLLMATLWRFYTNWQLARGSFKNNTLILGLSPQSQELYDFLLANPQLGYNALGIIDVKHDTAPEVLEDVIKQKNVKTLVLGSEAYQNTKIIDVLYRLMGRGMIFNNLSDFYETVSGKVPLGAIDQTWFLDNLTEARKRVYEIGKRASDLALAIAIGLIVSPFLFFVVLAIKLGSPGPIFYKQTRIGKSGKLFTLVKFRSMGKDAEKSGPVWASENDQRVNSVGRFLRRTRIDELPQVWNVLRGEMSFVGPRPERPEFYDKLRKEVPFYQERYLIKPGLTGWAQVKYKLDFAGGMTIGDTFEKVQHDLYYIKNRSFLLDVGIILKTINIVLQKLFAKSKTLIRENPTSPLSS